MSKRNRNRPAGAMNARDDGGLQGRAEAPGIDPAVAALIRAEIDARAVSIQAEAQARAQASVPDVSTREAAEKRINEMLAATTELRADNERLRGEMNALAARSAAPAQGFKPARSNARELAELLAEKGVCDLAARGWAMGQMVEVKHPLDLNPRAATVLDTSIAVAQSTVQPFNAMDQGYNRPRSMIDFVPELPPIGVTRYPFMRETAVGAGARGIHTMLTAQTASGSAVLVVDSTQGMYPGMTLRIHDAGAILERIVLTVDSTTQVTCTATMGATVETAQAVTSVDFGTSAEGYAKPAALWGYELSYADLRVLAHYIPMSVQAIATVPGLEAEIQSMLTDGLRYTICQQLVTGLGTAPSGNSAGQLHGFASSTTSPDYDWGDGAVGDTMFDAIAMATGYLRFAAPVTIHVNPFDLRKMCKAKVEAAGGGAYVFPLMGGQIDGYRAIDGTIVTAFGTIHPAWEVDEGDFYCVQHDLFSRRIRNTGMDRVVVGYTNTQFINNQQTILAETMVEQMILRPNALVIGEFDAAPSA